MNSHEEGVSLWQTTEWENFQKKLGHQALRVKIAEQGFNLLIYPLFFGKKYGYIPRPKKIPLDVSPEEITTLARKDHLVFLKVDAEEKIDPPSNFNYQPSSSPQPETTLKLDLHLSEKDLLSQMKRKGRYNISLAEKKGVVVKMAQGRQERQVFAKIFYDLLQHTTDRDGFSGHDEQYYQIMLECLPMSEVFMAFLGESPLAGAICTFHEREALYYYGASGNEHRELMAPYLVQWEAIREAKKRGCLSYDFLGIAPEDANDDHPWKGISEFKKKFGGVIVQYPKPIDLIFQPFWYKVYRLLKWIQKIVKK